METSAELDAVVRRIFRSMWVDQDATAVWNAAGGSQDFPSRAISPTEVWEKSPSDPDTAKLIVQRVREIGITDVEILTLETFQRGDFGWFFGEVLLLGGSEEIPRQRVTGVLVIETGQWRVLQWHQSVALSAAELYGVELSKDLGALVDALDSSSGETIGAASLNGTVTLLFTDVEDSTHIAETIGDAEWASLISRHLKSLSDTIERHRGTVVKTLGDGAMAAFPSVSDALSCAVVLHEESGDGLRIRIGLHTGDAVHENGDYAGITVNKAARVAAAAQPGEVLVSSVTAEMAIGRGFELGEGRTVELKGLTGTHRLTQILAGPEPSY